MNTSDLKIPYEENSKEAKEYLSKRSGFKEYIVEKNYKLQKKFDDDRKYVTELKDLFKSI